MNRRRSGRAVCVLLGIVAGTASAQVYQPAASTPEEYSDAIVAIGAGIEPASALLEQPELYRETLVFMQEFYEDLTGDVYSVESAIYHLNIASGDELSDDPDVVIGGVTLNGYSFQLMPEVLGESDLTTLPQDQHDDVEDRGIHRVWGVMGLVASATYSDEVYGLIFEHDTWGTLVWEFIPLGSISGDPVQRGLDGAGVEGGDDAQPDQPVGDIDQCWDICLSNYQGCIDNAKSTYRGRIAGIGAVGAACVIGCGIAAIVPGLGWGVAVPCLIGCHAAGAGAMAAATADYIADKAICGNNRSTCFRNCCIMFPDDCLQ